MAQRAPAKVTIAAASADSGPGAASAAARARDLRAPDSAGDQRGDEIGLGGEIAVDRAGRDAGALGDGGAICTAAMPPSLAASAPAPPR